MIGRSIHLNVRDSSYLVEKAEMDLHLFWKVDVHLAKK